MADDIDQANEQMLATNESLVLEARRRAQAIPTGAPGECENCGEDSLRLVGGLCARCRDKSEGV